MLTSVISNAFKLLNFYLLVDRHGQVTLIEVFLVFLFFHNSNQGISHILVKSSPSKNHLVCF
jgi:hypothetical protein